MDKQQARKLKHRQRDEEKRIVSMYKAMLKMSGDKRGVIFALAKRHEMSCEDIRQIVGVEKGKPIHQTPIFAVPEDLPHMFQMPNLIPGQQRESDEYRKCHHCGLYRQDPSHLRADEKMQGVLL